MNKKKSIDILLGDPRKAIIALSLPIMIALFVAEINTIVDRAWCSGMGSDTVAAVAVVRPVYNVLVGLGAGLGVGASAVISRHIGEGNRKKASSGSIQSLIIALVFGLVLTPVLLALQHPLLSAIGDGQILDESVSYMTIYSVCLLVITINGTLGGILNGQGALKLSTAMMLVLACSNMVLDPVFIYVLDMGVTGASVATIVSTLLSMCLGLQFVFGRSNYLEYSRLNLKWEKDSAHEVMAAGIPQMAEYLILYGMDAVLNYLVIVCAGTDGLTIFSTVDGLIILMTVPAMAVGSALVPVASSAYGQRNIERLGASFKNALLLGIGLVTALILVLELIPGPLLYAFTYSDDMSGFRPEMIHLLRFMCLYMPLFSFNPICSGYLQAVKHPNLSVFMAIWRNVALISFFWIASSHTLDKIGLALISGHLVGMASMCLLTHWVSSKVDTEMAVAHA